MFSTFGMLIHPHVENTRWALNARLQSLISKNWSSTSHFWRPRVEWRGAQQPDTDIFTLAHGIAVSLFVDWLSLSNPNPNDLTMRRSYEQAGLIAGAYGSDWLSVAVDIRVRVNDGGGVGQQVLLAERSLATVQGKIGIVIFTGTTILISGEIIIMTALIAGKISTGMISFLPLLVWPQQVTFAVQIFHPSSQFSPSPTISPIFTQPQNQPIFTQPHQVSYSIS